ncbi:brain tumor protein-like [Uloborus diversus]|uniref:brain tumor protein-like n=1 Tax=Uloborus diversus TaxID=327109 RepID=UPI00240961E9|nr:brain tumor protein-like [Uloborus diversus]
MASVDFHCPWSFGNQRNQDISSVNCSNCQEHLNGSDSIFCTKCKLPSESSWPSKVSPVKQLCCQEKDRDLVAYCFTCGIDLCHVCCIEHQFIKQYEGHNVSILSDHLKKESLSLPNTQLTCCLHKDENLRYFCQTCGTLICEECALKDHPKELHDYEFVETDLNLKIKQEIVKKIEVKSTELKAASKLIAERRAHLQEQYNKAQFDINKASNFFYSVIENRKQQLLKELEDIYLQKLGPLESVSNQISDVLRDSLHSSTLMDSSLFSDYSNVTSVIENLYFNNVIEQAQKLTAQLFSLEFLSNYQAIKVGVQDTFGFIHHKQENSLVGKLSTGVHDIKMDVIGPKLESNLSSICDVTSNMGFFDTKSPFKKKTDSETFLNGSVSTFHAPILPSNEPLKNNLLPPLHKYFKREKMTYYNKFGEFGILEGQFAEPSGVAVNSKSEIIVADTNNHRIQIFDADGKFKFKFGEVGKSDGQFYFPNRVAVLPNCDDIVVTERNPTHQVQVYNQYGQFVRKFGSDVLQHPRGVTVDNEGRIIVVECKVMKVVIFDLMGNVLKKFGCSKYVEFPNGVAVNDKQEIFISDNRGHCVKVFNYDGAYLRQIGCEGLTNYPIGVSINKNGEILIADNHSSFNVTIFTQDGQLIKGLESKAKHVQCFDTTVLDPDSVVLASKDFRLYLYRYNA